MAKKNTFENAREIVPIDQIVSLTLEKIKNACEYPDMLPGISTGIMGLDDITGGLQNSNLILLAARPAMGKSTLALNIAENAVVAERQPTAIFSLGMTSTEVVARLLAQGMGTDHWHLCSGDLTDAEIQRLEKEADAISKSGYFIDDTPAISALSLREKCRQIQEKCGLGLVIVDYLQLMQSGQNSDSRDQEIADILVTLKNTARELEIPIIVLSQLPRKIEPRKDKRPLLSDLNSMGPIVQYVDEVMFLYRDEYYYFDSKDKGTAEIILAKNNNGPVSAAKIAWNPERMRFSDFKED